MSDLHLASIPTKRSIGWKIYFVILTLLAIFGFVGIFSKPNVGYPEYVNLLTYLIGTVGLAGFVFNRKIWKPVFWRYFVFLDLVISISY